MTGFVSADYTSNLVGNWDFENNGLDETANSYDLTISTGTAEYVTDSIVGDYSWNHTIENVYFVDGDISDFDSDADITWMNWIKVDPLQGMDATNYLMTWFSKPDGANWAKYAVRFYYVNGAIKWGLFLSSVGAQDYYCNDNSTLNNLLEKNTADGGWHHYRPKHRIHALNNDA